MGMVAHMCKPSSQEGEAGESLRLGPVWATWVQGQSELHRTTLSQKITTIKTNKNSSSEEIMRI